MHHRHTEPPLRLQYTCCLADSLGEIVDVLERQVRDDAVELSVREWKCCSIRNVCLDLRVGGSRGRDHGRRDIYTHNVVAQRLEVAGEAAFATPEIECSTASRRYKFKEEVALEEPVAVVAGFAGPGHPLGRVFFPRPRKICRPWPDPA